MLSVSIFLLSAPLTEYTRTSYFEIIKNPIDLNTMGIKLSQGMYKDRFAFEADFRLMIRNAKTYNSPDTYVYNEGAALEQFFDTRE